MFKKKILSGDKIPSNQDLWFHVYLLWRSLTSTSNISLTIQHFNLLFLIGRYIYNKLILADIGQVDISMGKHFKSVSWINTIHPGEKHCKQNILFHNENVENVFCMKSVSALVVANNMNHICLVLSDYLQTASMIVLHSFNINSALNLL